MPLDAVALGVICNELDTVLKDAKVEKVHQPEADELLLLLKNKNGAYRLVVSASSENARIHLALENKENPSTPPMFCMLLRKHLTGARVEEIKRIGYERAIDIVFSGRNEMGDITKRHLICEIMGRNSNIIFLDENEKIIDSVKHIDLTVSSKRNILPGLKYMLPPASDRLNPLECGEDEFYSLLKNSPDGCEAEKAIVSGVMGISPLLAGECVYRACGQRKVVIGELNEAGLHLCAINLKKMFQDAQTGEVSPCIVVDDVQKKVIDFAPFALTQYTELRCSQMESMNDAAREFYYMRDLHARMQNRSSNITKIINNNLHRCEKKLNLLQKELCEAGERDKFKIAGDLIVANLYKIKKGDSTLRAINFYDENQAETVIELNTTKTPSENAQIYYTKYKKAKNTEIYATGQIEKTIDEIKYLESVLYSVQNAQSPSELAEIRSELADFGYIKRENSKKRKDKNAPVSKPMEFEYKGYTIFVGKNNVQNDYLTLKMGRSRDLWLHSKNIAGSHVLVKFMGEDFPNEVIEMAASLAAYYSKGKNSQYVEVDYCPVSHVKKPSGAKAGMVIYEGYNSALVEPAISELIRK